MTAGPARPWLMLAGLTLGVTVAQTVGPYGAGLVGDLAGSIGISLLASSGVLLIGAALAYSQRPLKQTG